MRPASIALWAGVLPILCAHINYLIAAYYGHVPWCFPYWDSCTSISATGRKLPEFILFKLLMMPAAVLMLFYWGRMKQWLLLLNDPNPKALMAIHWLGTLAGLALILYTAALGSIGDIYQATRRVGITLFFGFTAIAHLIVVQRLSVLLTNHPTLPLHRIYRWQLGLSSLLLTGGVANTLLHSFYNRFDDINDAIEWNFAMVMMLQFIVSYFAWKVTRFQERYSIEQ